MQASRCNTRLATLRPLVLALLLAGCGWIAAAGATPAEPAVAAVQPGARTEVPSAADLLRRYREASGGAAWADAGMLRSSGRLSVAGLSGSFEALEDPASGRSASHYDLGPVQGAEGFDGTAPWSQDPGGEVRRPDSAEALANARSQAWQVRRGYWFPQRQAASYGPVEARRHDDRDWWVVEARPVGATPLSLWFDADDGLLKRVQTRIGQDLTTTDYSDWRKVGALTLPFAAVTDRGDPRNLVKVEYQRIEAGLALADTSFAVPGGDTRARIASADGRTEVEFELLNNHLFAAASIDGQPVRVLVDTGGLNILTPAAARRLGLASAGQMAARGVGEQQVDVAFAKAGRLQFGAVELDQPVIYVMDLGPLPDIEGVDFDGIVGYELFHRFGVTIDYAAGRIVLVEPGRFQPPAGASAIPFELADRIPVIEAKLDGRPVRLTVDTGSRASLSLHSPFVRQHDLQRHYRARHQTVVGWGVGGPALGWPVRLGELQLGPHLVRQLAGDLFTGDKGAFADPHHAGNLGGGVLKRFTVGFDYAQRQMWLAPNAQFDAVDEFDRSGLWLRRDGTALRVLAVAPDSAAARAGLEAEQRILQIDGQPVAGRPLHAWRALLRDSAAGTRLALQVEGRAQPVELRLQDQIAAQAVVAAR